MAFYYLKVVKSKNLEFGGLLFWAGPLITYGANLITIFIRSWSFWKQKYGVYGFPHKAFRISDYKIDTHKPHQKLLHRFLLVLSRRQQWNWSGNQWREHVLLHASPASRSDPCDVCARNNVCGRGTGLKIWQYLLFSERCVASKLLLMPFQPFNP